MVKYEFYYTYVLRSSKDGKLYIGSTELIYFEGCFEKSKAEKREKYFKTGFGRNFLKSRI